MNRQEIFNAINEERLYQDEKWGTEFDDKNTPNDWATYLMRYTSFTTAEKINSDERRDALIKVATLAVAAIEAQDRVGDVARHYD